MIVYGQYVSRMGIDENLTLKNIQDSGIIFPEKISLVGFLVLYGSLHSLQPKITLFYCCSVSCQEAEISMPGQIHRYDIIRHEASPEDYFVRSSVRPFLTVGSLGAYR